VTREAAVGVDRADVDDRGVAGEVGERTLGAVEAPAHVEVEERAEGCRVGVLEGHLARDARVVHEPVEAAERGRRLVDHAPAVIQVGQVARHGDGRAGELERLGERRVG
jgi:hypothetical protein